MSGVLDRRRRSDAGVSVKYTPCSKGEHTEEEELGEIAIVEKEACLSRGEDFEINPDLEVTLTANGPGQLPGLEVYPSPSDRIKLIGERLSGCDRISISSPIYSDKLVEQRSSKQSLLELVTSKFDRVKSRKRLSSKDLSLMNKVRSFENITTKEIRKHRKRELEDKFGKKGRSEVFETSTSSSDKGGCNWSFVFDPSGRLCYWWSSVVSIAFLYNFWVIIYRFAFQEIDSKNLNLWFTLDYSADLLYILDIAFHFRTGYLEDGVLQTDSTKLRIHYTNATVFYIDCLCLLPLDFLYLSIGFCSILRCFRLVKVYRFWAFLDRTERHTNYPNVMRTMTLMHYLLALFHWNACLFYLVATQLENTKEWTIPNREDDVLLQYLKALYWSTLTFTTMGGLPSPRTTSHYLFIIFEMITGLLLFATVLGHISNIVASVSAARKDFQGKVRKIVCFSQL